MNEDQILKTEQQFIGLMLHDREELARWSASGVPAVDQFSAQMQPLATRITEHWTAHQTLYTRETAAKHAEALTKQEGIAYRVLWTTCFQSCTTKPDNVPILAAAIADEAKNRVMLVAAEMMRSCKNPEEIREVLGQVTPSVKKVEEPPLTFDMSRLPPMLARGVAGLFDLNDLLSESAQIMVPFVVAGTAIGKRMEIDNFCNTYYPNLWAVSISQTNTNKTGTRNIALNAIPEESKLPESPTLEALIDRLGGSFKSDANLDQALAQSRIRARTMLGGKAIIADEVTGTFRRLIGESLGQGRGEGNIENVLKLATSGESLEQPRIGAGYRLATDTCVSLLGFTQSETWENSYGDERYRNNGLIGRIIPCADGLVLENLPKGDRNDWQRFVKAASCSGDPFSDDNRDKRKTWTVTREHDPVKPVMIALKTTRAWQTLQEAVGTYSDRLHGKVIGHGLKMAMVCSWVNGDSDPFQWLSACCELACACYANYFSRSAREAAKLSARDHAALVYVRANPGCSANQVRRKLNLRDMREAWLIIETLEEEEMIDVRNGKRKDTKALYPRAATRRVA